MQKLELRLPPDTLLSQLFFYFGTAALIIAFCIGVSKFLERFQPRLYELITGARVKQINVQQS